jgi:hypothetical protein
MSIESKVRERRRGERVLIRVAIEIHGTGKDGKPVHGPAEAVVVNRNGALLRTAQPLKQGSTLEVLQGGTEAKPMAFRVVWCSDRPREGRYDIGVELLEHREELWGIRFPPAPPGSSNG